MSNTPQRRKIIIECNLLVECLKTEYLLSLELNKK